MLVVVNLDGGDARAALRRLRAPKVPVAEQ
jgi:hypothetical protein